MDYDPQIQEIIESLSYLQGVYSNLLKLLPSFNITDNHVLPYGLKPHTRSVSWLVEQVITQQTKYRVNELGLDNVIYQLPDTELHDCIIYSNEKEYFVNIKIHSMNSNRETKNDIAALEKLYIKYNTNENYNLIYACFGIIFDNINIQFSQEYLVLFSAQFLPIYLNPKNHKLQAFYHHNPVLRKRYEFIEELSNRYMNIINKK